MEMKANENMTGVGQRSPEIENIENAKLIQAPFQGWPTTHFPRTNLDAKRNIRMEMSYDFKT